MTMTMTTTNTIRAFIALPCPKDARDAMADLQSLLKNHKADVKWDDPEKFHITLKFLGNVDSEKLLRTSIVLRERVNNIGVLDVTYCGIGAFPSLSGPRVIWIGVLDNELITRVQQIVETTFLEHGLGEKEHRSFHPHITLGRVKSERGLARLTATLKNTTFESFPTRCTEVLVMHSELLPTGSRYTTLNSIPLTT